MEIVVRGKRNSSKFKQSKRQLLVAIASRHNHKENPVDHETQIVVITRALRVLEQVWKSCGPEEVWNCLRSVEWDRMPRVADFIKKLKK